jgi:hypothetical protein
LSALKIPYEAGSSLWAAGVFGRHLPVFGWGTLLAQSCEKIHPVVPSGLQQHLQIVGGRAVSRESIIVIEHGATARHERLFAKQRRKYIPNNRK